MAAATTTSANPDLRFLLSHPAHFIALGFGSGLMPRAPGTFGTLAGWGLYAVLELFIPGIVIAFLAIPLVLLGIWACDVTGKHLGVQDHPAMVFDEIVAFLPLAAFAAAAWYLQLVAFVLFRIFDIWKPYPIRQIDANVKGGLGVMVDDLVAGFYAFIAFAVFVIIMYKGFGFA